VKAQEGERSESLASAGNEDLEEGVTYV